MQIAALILGVIGGLSALSLGWFITAAVTFAGASRFIAIVGVVVPLVGLVGACLSLATPKLAGAMMLGSAVMFAMLTSFSIFGVASILLLAIAGGLALYPAVAAFAGNHGSAAPPDPTGYDERPSLKVVQQSLSAVGRRAQSALLGMQRPSARFPVQAAVPRARPEPDQREPLVRLIPAKNGHPITLPPRKLTRGGVVLGREQATADAVIADKSISREHARIWIDKAARLMVEDLKSTNGTWCNDTRVGRAVLEPGARLRLGNVTFAIEREA